MGHLIHLGVHHAQPVEPDRRTASTDSHAVTDALMPSDLHTAHRPQKLADVADVAPGDVFSLEKESESTRALVIIELAEAPRCTIHALLDDDWRHIDHRRCQNECELPHRSVVANRQRLAVWVVPEAPHANESRDPRRVGKLEAPVRARSHASYDTAVRLERHLGAEHRPLGAVGHQAHDGVGTRCGARRLLAVGSQRRETENRGRNAR
jgi:hypothetical protein